MTNASTVADLKRVQRGLIQRAPKWDALTSNMQNAAAEALRQIKSVSQAMGSFLYLANPIDMGTMENVAFSRATISGLPIGAIASPTGPIMHGFFWFQAIFIAKYGPEQNPYKIVESRLPVGSGPSSFDDLRLPSKSTQQSCWLELCTCDRLDWGYDPIDCHYPGGTGHHSRRRNYTGFDWHGHSWPGHIVDQRHV